MGRVTWQEKHSVDWYLFARLAYLHFGRAASIPSWGSRVRSQILVKTKIKTKSNNLSRLLEASLWKVD